MGEHSERKCLFDFGDEFLESFDVKGEIGRGSFGAVLRANQISLGREVAIKYLLPNLSGDELNRRFKREARVLCSLNHPNIINIYSFGFDGKAVYLVQELLEGQTVENWFDKTETPEIPELVSVCVEVASALAYSHEKGIVHRDVKPANIFLCSNGSAKLLDFGLAKGRAFDTQLTATGCLAGTPLYLAPEQLYESEPNGASDVYALGIVLYEGLAGTNPFECASLDELYRDKISSKPTPLKKVRSDLPSSLCSLVDQMVELEGEDRPSASHVEKKLRAFLSKGIQGEDERNKETDATLPITAKPSISKRWILVLAIFLVILCGVSYLVLGKESPFELDIKVVSASASTITVSIESTLAANVKVDVIDGKTRAEYGTFVMPGRGRRWRERLDRLPAARDFTLVARALVVGKQPKVVQMSAQTKAVGLKQINQWQAFEVDEGPALSSDRCCVLTEKKGFVTFQLATGEVLWQLPPIEGVQSIKGNEQAIYVVTKEGLLEARSWSDGAKLWSVDLKGKTSDPRVEDEIVVIKGTLGKLFCFEGATGKVRWTVDMLLRGGWSVSGGKAYICTVSGSLIKVDVESGRVTNTSLLKASRLTENPCRVGDYWCFFYDESHLLISLKDEPIHRLDFKHRVSDAKGDDETLFTFEKEMKKLWAIDVKRGKRLWSTSIDIDIVGMFVKNGLLIVTDKSSIRCFHSTNGNLLWQIRERVTRRFAPLPIEDGFVFWSRDGKVWCVKI